MSYTTLPIIKKHLLSAGFGPLRIENQSVMLNGETEVELPHHNLVDQSESVKWAPQIQATVEGPIVLTGTDWVALGSGRIVSGGAVVATGQSLAAIFAEESDYQLDYAQGRIRRVATGSMADPQTVWVFSHHYSMFARDQDYQLDCGRGMLHRIDGGAIPDGAHVLVDYEVTAACVTDELINQAITEGEDLIGRTLSSTYSTGTGTQGLQTGATQLAMAILARDMAVEVLSRRTSTDAAARAKEWQSLATLYETRAWETLRPFLDPYALHSPEKMTRA
jgi:hypothetical protein